MKRSAEPNRMSAKRLASLGGAPQYSTITKRGGKIKVNHKRKRKTRLAAHGSKARNDFVGTLPCSACGVEGHSQPAHVLGNGGMGKKKGPETIAPLCGPQPCYDGDIYDGCHALFDRKRWEFNLTFPNYDPAEAAARCNAAWLASLPPLEASPK